MGDVQSTASSATPAIGLDGERIRRLYRALLLPRLIEEKALLLLRQGRLSKWFSGMAQEAIAVGVTFALEADDWILRMHRNLGVFTTRGVDLGRLFRQLFGKDGGFTKGRDRTFHFGLLEKRIVGMISHLGATVPVADGLALAAQLRGERRVAATFSGDGGTSEGDFHDAVNLASVWKLPAGPKPVIDALVDEALAAPDPVSNAEHELADVYAPSALRVEEPPPSAASSERRYIDAIQDGLREVMRRRRDVILMGQDIAEYGGVFKVTEGFVAEFGNARVRNTPIIESGAVGAALR